MQPRALRALFYLDSPQALAGAPRQLLLFLKHAGRDVEPHVVVPMDGLCVRAFRDVGAEVTIIQAPERLLLFEKQLLRVSTAKKAAIWASDVLPHSWAVASFARRIRAEVFHFNGARGILAAGPAARLAGCPAVLHVRGSFAYDGLLRHAAQAFASRIILNAEALRAEITPIFRSRCVAVHDGVELPTRWTRSEARRAIGERLGRSLDESTPIVLSLSSLVPFKGLHVLMDALGKVAASGAPAPVVLCGGAWADEKYEQHIHAKIDALGLRDVHLLGYVPDPEQLLAAADLLVLPTIDRTTFTYADGEQVAVRSNEGLPQAVLEAMASGLPVVASRVAGTPEQVTDGVTGLLVPQGDVDALAGALSRLLSDKALRARMGAAARTDATARFEPRTQAKKTLTELASA